MEIQRRKLLATSLSLGLALVITGMPIHFDPDSHALKAGYDPAYAKDDGDDDSSDDSDDDDGGDDGSDHDSGDDHGGDDDSNDDNGGKDDGPDHDANDDSRDRTSNRSSRSSSTSSFSQSDRTGRVRKAERHGGNIEVKFADGWKEEIENGRYELKDPAGRTVVERASTQADFNRLSLAFR